MGEVTPQPATLLPERILRGRYRCTWQPHRERDRETDRRSGRRDQEKAGGTTSGTGRARRQRVEAGCRHRRRTGAARVASHRLGHRGAGGVSHGGGPSDFCGHTQELLAASGSDTDEATWAPNGNRSRDITDGIRVGTARGTAIVSRSRVGGDQPVSASAGHSSRQLHRPRGL